MFQSLKPIAILFCLVSAFWVDSSAQNSEPNALYKIVGRKWSINPDVGPDGRQLKIMYSEWYDHMQYYAFNDDYSVDRWGNRTDVGTGVFSVEGNMVTCKFVEEVSDRDTITADDGDYNSQIILKWHDNKLYKYDKLIRTNTNEWKSIQSPEYRTLYFKDVGRYSNKKYNISATELGFLDFKRRPYDTTMNAVAVEERFNWRSEITYADGKRNGIYKFYEDGLLTVFGEYTNGEPSGTWYYFTQGVLVRRKDY